MKIGIEAQRIFRTHKHGMDYVVLQEILQLQQLDHDNEYYVFVKPGPDRCLRSTNNFHIVELNTPTYPLWEQWALPRAVKKAGVELLHCTSNTAPLHCHVPLILTLHDIIFLEPSQHSTTPLYQRLGRLYRRWVVPRILPHCRRIITVSHFEEQNIISSLHIEQERMAMIYNGYNEWFRPLTDTESVYKKYIAEDGFLFFLGNTDPKKNTENTLIAYAKYLELSAVKRPLLMADLDKRYLNDILGRNGITHIQKHLVMPGYIVNSDLPYLYNAAFAFLYPSLRESFGIPLLEAMACGTPVVTSNTSSMPEIAGPDALLINPSRPDEIAQALIKLETDSTLYAKQHTLGPRRSSLFSWRNTAQQLSRLYQEVAQF